MYGVAKAGAHEGAEAITGEGERRPAISTIFRRIKAADGIKVIRKNNGRAGLLLHLFGQSAGAELAGISVVDQYAEDRLATLHTA